MNKIKVIERIYHPFLKKSLNNQLITVIIGPRQSGKTTSISNFLNNVKTNRKFYLSLDSSFERDRVREKEYYLQEQVEETLGFPLDTLKDRFYLFIDEAQKLPSIFESIRLLFPGLRKMLFRVGS